VYYLLDEGGHPDHNVKFETEDDARDWLLLVKPEGKLALVWFGPEPTDNIFVAWFEDGEECAKE
jgi:hypothetical protein